MPAWGVETFLTSSVLFPPLFIHTLRSHVSFLYSTCLAALRSIALHCIALHFPNPHLRLLVRFVEIMVVVRALQVLPLTSFQFLCFTCITRQQLATLPWGNFSLALSHPAIPGSWDARARYKAIHTQIARFPPLSEPVDLDFQRVRPPPLRSRASLTHSVSIRSRGFLTALPRHTFLQLAHICMYA